MSTNKVKIIFLDIDGVLNNVIEAKKERWDISIRCVGLPNELVEGTDAKIVISSTWRYGLSIEEITQRLVECDFKYPESIIDVTPRMTSVGILRGNEILQWMKNNSALVGGYYEFSSYVILDDDSDMLYWQKDNFLIVDGYCGLTPSIVYKAKFILNQKYER